MSESVALATIPVREYCEEMQVELRMRSNDRLVIRCYNECGNNITEMDLMDLLEYLKKQGAVHVVDTVLPSEAWIGRRKRR
jgi:hypothetical protein